MAMLGCAFIRLLQSLWEAGGRLGNSWRVYDWDIVPQPGKIGFWFITGRETQLNVIVATRSFRWNLLSIAKSTGNITGHTSYPFSDFHFHLSLQWSSFAVFCLPENSIFSPVLQPTAKHILYFLYFLLWRWIHMVSEIEYWQSKWLSCKFKNI